jgi:succinoglycan biosynthesis transport protein ExoP
MSRYFELTDEHAHDSEAQPLVRTAPNFKPSLPNRYTHRAVHALEETFLAGLWRIVRNRKWTIASFALVVVVMVVTASLLMKPRYDAVGRVLFYHEDEGGVLGFKGANPSLPEDPDDRAAIDTQIGILQSDGLASQVIHDLHLDSNPKFFGGKVEPGNEDRLLQAFHENLTISKIRGTRLIQIKFRAKDPQLAADVVNYLTKAYVDRNYRSQLHASTQMSEFLSNQLTELKAKVEESQQKLVDYQNQNGIFGLDDKQNIVTAKLDDLNKELTAAEAERIQKEANYRLAQSSRPELIAKLEPDNLITKLRAQQAELQTQIAQASVQLGPTHPKMRELANQLAATRRSIRTEVRRTAERITDEYKTAEERERMLRSALEAQKQAADKLNANAIQYNLLKRDFETNRKLYEDLLQKQKELGISATLNLSGLRVIDPARPPRLPAEPNILRNFALALLFGIIGGVLLAVGLVKMNEPISTLEQAQILSPLPALGVLPLLEANSGNGALALPNGAYGPLTPELVSILEPLSPAAESYRALLTSILLSHSTPPTVIMMTSALPAEGKTTVSINTAIALARSRRRVLLVDADLRRPSIHRAMRLPSDTGLTAVLRESTSLEQAVVRCSDLPNLFILPAGQVRLPDDTEQLICCFKELLEPWREQFDHVIVDTPPVLPLTDAVRMSVEADSVILVVRSGQIVKDAFLRAQDLLLKVNAHLTGFVLNGADLNSPDFRHYYGYYGEGYTKRPDEAA